MFPRFFTLILHTDIIWSGISLWSDRRLSVTQATASLHTSQSSRNNEAVPVTHGGSWGHGSTEELLVELSVLFQPGASAPSCVCLESFAFLEMAILNKKILLIIILSPSAGRKWNALVPICNKPQVLYLKRNFALKKTTSCEGLAPGWFTERCMLGFCSFHDFSLNAVWN